MYASPEHKFAGTAAEQGRDHNCIEMNLKNIEAELAESFNSAENLADKLKGHVEPPAQAGLGNIPVCSDVNGRLEQILNAIRSLNQQLGRAHSAISG